MDLMDVQEVSVEMGNWQDDRVDDGDDGVVSDHCLMVMMNDDHLSAAAVDPMNLLLMVVDCYQLPVVVQEALLVVHR